MPLVKDHRKIVSAICRRLRRAYGPVEPPAEWPVLDELVATILSQNTSDANSDAAFEELRRRFDDWDAVRRLPRRGLRAPSGRPACPTARPRASRRFSSKSTRSAASCRSTSSAPRRPPKPSST